MNRITNSPMFKSMWSFMAGAFTVGRRAPDAAGRPAARTRGAYAFIGMSVLALSAFAMPAFAQNTILVNKSFGATSISPGGTTSMTITLENTDTAGAQTGLGFADNFPAGLTWTSITSNTCGGTLTPAAGPAATLTLSGGTIVAATGSGTSSCQIVVQVTSNVAGGKTNTIPAGAVTAAVNGNATQNGTGASATLLVSASTAAGINKSFSPSTMTVGGVTTMTLTISNPNGFALTNVGLSDNFATDVTRSPAGPGVLRVAAGAVSSTCGATPTAAVGSGLVTLSGGTVPAGGSCTITVPVEATDNGTYTNTIPAGRLTTDQGATTTNPAVSGAVAVQNGLLISKDHRYPGGTIPLGASFGPIVYLDNPYSETVTNVTFTDYFPDSDGDGIYDYTFNSGAIIGFGGGVVAFGCTGPTYQILPGGIGFTVTFATMAPGGHCEVYVTGLTATDATNGSHNVIPSGLTDPAGGGLTGQLPDGSTVGNIVPAEWFVNINPNGGNGFILNAEKHISVNGVGGGSSTVVAPGQPAHMLIALRNPNGFSATGGTFTDTFQVSTVEGATSDMVLAPTPNFIFTNCGEAGNPNFTPAYGYPSPPVPPTAMPHPSGNGFTLNNLSVIRDSAGGVNAGLVCVVQFDVVATVPGQHVNRIFQAAGSGFTGIDAPAGIGGGMTATPSPDVATVIIPGPLSATKSFSEGVIANNVGINRLTVTLTNNSTLPLANLAFTDAMAVHVAEYPDPGGASMLVASPANIVNTCGGTVSAAPDTRVWTLSGGTLPAQVGGVDGTCTISMDIRSYVGSAYLYNGSVVSWAGAGGNNIPAGAVSGTIVGTGAVVTNPLAAYATFNSYPLALQATKSFSPGTIQGGGLSDLTITLTNPYGTAGTYLSGVSVTDNLPTGMIVADPVVTSTTCTSDGTTGGTPANVNATALASSFQMTGGYLLATQSCTVTVRVTALQTGTLTNTLQAGDATSTNGVASDEAFSANLVVQPRVGVEKQFIPNRIPVGGTSELEIRVFNANNAPATNISITDNMPAQVLLASPLTFNVVAGTSCPGVNVTGAPGSSSFTLNNLTLPAFTECRVRVLVTSNDPSEAPHWVNTILPANVSSLEGGINTDLATDTLEVYSAPVVTKSFSDASISLSETSTLTIRVANPAASGSLTSVVFTDNLPAGIAIADVPAVTTSASCATGTVTGGTAGATSIGWTGGTLAFGEFCEITVAVKGTAVGNYLNELPACTAATAVSAGATVCNADPSTAPIEVTDFPSVLTFVKTLAAENGAVAGAAEPGEQLTYNIVITNTGGIATNIPVADLVPANTTFVSADNGGVLNGTQVDWTITVPELGSVTLAVTFQVADPIPASVTEIANSVTVNAVPCATVPCVVTPVVKPAFTISKALTGETGATAGVAEPSEQLTYTITINNTSAVPATNVPVVDIVPANTTFVSAGNGGVLNGGQVEWTLPTLAANSSTTLTVTFAVVDPIPAGVTAIANSATVEVPGEPPVVCTTVPCVSTPTGDFDLDFTKTLTGENGTTAGIAEPGEQLTYTITINNTGSANAIGVPVVDAVPTNTTFVSATAGGVLNGAQVDWSVDVPAGGATVVTVTFAVVSPIPAGITEIANSATVNGAPCTTLPCVTTPTAKPAFTIGKTLTGENGATAGIAEPGEQLTYTITVANTSNVDAANVPVIDIVPTNTAFSSAGNGGVLNGSQVEWTIPALAANSSTTLTVTFTVVDPIPTGVTAIANSATVEVPGEPPVVCTTVPCVTTPTGDFSINFTKTLTGENGAQTGIAEPGEQLTYTITINNTGAANAISVPVVDTVPANTTFVSATAGGVLNGAQVDWTVDVPAGGSTSVTVTFAVVDPVPADVTAIANNATVDGQVCVTTPCVETPLADPEFTIVKALTGESGSQAGSAEPGETLTYTLTVSNTSGVDATNVPVIDLVPANTTYVSSSNGGALNGAQVEWTLSTLAANSSATLTVTFQVDATLPATVTEIANTATVNPPGEPPVPCATVPCVVTPVAKPTFAISKALTGEDGSQAGSAEPGETLTYTLNVSNTSGVDAVNVPVIDFVPANTTYVSSSNGGALNGAQVEWTLPTLAANSSTTVTVSFVVDAVLAAGVTEIANTATVNPPGEPPVPCATQPCVVTPTAEPTFAISKALSAETGTQASLVEPGEELTYTLTVSNTSGVDASAVPVSDIVPQYLTYVSSSDGGALAGTQVNWSLDLPANSSHDVTVTFRVDATLPAGSETIANSATVNPPGKPPVVCVTVPCVVTPVAQPELEIAKVLSAENGTLAGQVEPGELLSYTVTVSNVSGVGATDVSVVDLVPANTTFVSADNGGTLNGNEVRWTLPTLAAGQSQSLLVVFQMASPIPTGVRSIINDATADFPTNPEPPVTCATVPCVTTPVVLPPIAVDDDGGTHPAGLPVAVVSPSNDIATSAPLDPTTVHIVGTANPGDPLTVPGEGTWTVDPVTGAITFTPEPGFTETPTPIHYTINDTLGQTSNEAEVILDYVIEQLLRITKSASVRTVVIGDLVRYTINLENLGDVDLVGVELIDTPALGFGLVAESLTVVDTDSAGSLNGVNPVRVGGLDIPAGQTATVSYLMTVGANVLPGTHINTVQAYINDVPISNVATATVVSNADPLFEESLIMGTVFNDRDEDGWQDSAEATDVSVIGGIDESAYMAGSTTVDRGAGPQPEADASAPLNHGIALGTIHGRSTIAEPEDRNQVVISQRLREPKFNTDFVLTTGHGTTVRVNAAGESSVSRSGRAGKGLTAEDIRVKRVVTPENGAYRVDYVVTNAGVQEQGIPGVRIGTVEGLLIETDRYGRYHLEGISPSHFARGSNFVLKVDAATLPSGSTFTTENPRVRRITPGIPVRFDFGVKMTEGVLETAKGHVDMSLGEVVFDADSAVIRPAYVEVIDFIAGKVTEHGGGEVEIVGYGGDPELAYARAQAVQKAVAAKLDAAVAKEMTVTVRGEVDGPEVLSFGHRTVLGEVFFDTDKTLIKSAFVPVIEKIAADIQAGGVPEVLLTGHADKRASDAYNVDLGKRRAKSVYDAIAARLTAERKEKLHVEYLPPSSPEDRYTPGKSE